MALVRWSPWGELTNLHEQMDQLFQQVFGEPLARGSAASELTLPVDIRQSEASYIIEASVPGFRPDEVEVTYDDGVLTIRGERRASTDANEGDYLRRERRVASVFRQVILPGEIQPEGITATFESGVLAVTVPRIPKPEAKRIPVTAGAARVGAPTPG
jgi:HSP20 family protein